MNNFVWCTSDGHFKIQDGHKVHDIDSDLLSHRMVSMLNTCMGHWFTVDCIEPLKELIAEQGIILDSETQNQPGADIEITSTPT